MALPNSIVDVAFGADAFTAVQLRTTTDPALGRTEVQNRDNNLKITALLDTVYQFAQTKAAWLKPNFKQFPDFDGEMFMYYRVGHMKWTEKIYAAQKTPFEQIENDKRSAPRILLHTGTLDDVDYSNNRIINLDGVKQLEWTYALARAYDQTAQRAILAPAIALTSNLSTQGFPHKSSGTYQSMLNPSLISLPDTQLKVFSNKSSSALAVQTMVDGKDALFDDLSLNLELSELSLMDQLIVGNPKLRRRLKDIPSFRDMESTVHLRGGNENADVLLYKDLNVLFLKPQVFINQLALFNGKYFDIDGNLVASSYSGTKTQLAASLSQSTYDMFYMLDLTGICQANSPNASQNNTGQLELYSFANVRYMKVGFGYGRMDEAKVTLVLYKL